MISLNEEFKVRALNGKVLGDLLAEQYNKIAILTTKDALCSSIAAPLYSKLIEKNKKVELFVIENLDDLISKLKEFEPEVISFFIGKNTKDDKLLFLLKEILVRLKNLNYEGDFFFHMRITKGTGKYKKLEEFKDFLNERSYTYNFDFDRGYLKILFIDFETNELIPIREYPLLFEHTKLANKVYKDREVCFKEL